MKMPLPPPQSYLHLCWPSHPRSFSRPFRLPPPQIPGPCRPRVETGSKEEAPSQALLPALLLTLGIMFKLVGTVGQGSWCKFCSWKKGPHASSEVQVEDICFWSLLLLEQSGSPQAFRLCPWLQMAGAHSLYQKLESSACFQVFP